MSEIVISATYQDTYKPSYKRTGSAIGTEADSPLPTPAPSRTPSPSRSTRGSTQMLLDEAILSRHSTRLYLPKPVPREILEASLELATHAPSDTNTQAWRLFVVTGAALARLKSSLLRAATAAAPAIPPTPPVFAPYRAALGRAVFGEGWGLARNDAAGRRAAVMRNFEFFGAPVGIIVCMSAALDGHAALSVGLYLQTLLLALTQRGVGSCVEISVAGYPDVVRQEVGIPRDLTVLVGVAVGFEDAGANVNHVRVARDAVGLNTAWVEE